LWKSDGTEAGTVLVKDGLVPRTPYSGTYPPFAVNLNGKLLFSAFSSFHDDDGAEFWISDGTTIGTVPLLAEATDSSIPRGAAAIGGEIYFVAGDGVHGHEIWKSDGTSAGTLLVKDIYSGPQGSYPGGF